MDYIKFLNTFSREMLRKLGLEAFQIQVKPMDNHSTSNHELVLREPLASEIRIWPVV